MRSLFLLVLACSIFGCATNVTSIKVDADKNLKAGRAYVLLGLETDRDLKKISISGPQNISMSHKDLKQGSNYLLVDLKAGTYTIDRVHLDSYWRVYFKEEYWQFTVSPDQISYVGHLELVNHGYWATHTETVLANRSSEALEFLEDKYPNILANRKLTYGGPGSDNFFDYVQSLKQE